VLEWLLVLAEVEGWGRDERRRSIPENSAAEVGLSGEDRSGKAVCPGSEPITGGDDTEFIVVVCNDLS
jgi:hypothetical protein